MGSACACLHSDSELADFWQKIQLRNIKPKDWNQIIKNKKDKTSDNNHIPEKNWRSIIDLNLSNPERKECSEKIFLNAMNKSEAKNSQAYMLLSCLFLCEKDAPDAKNVKVAFVDLSNDNGFKNYLRVDEKGVTSISKVKLGEIVSFYVDLVSLFGIKIIYSGKKEISEKLEQTYAEDIQKKFTEDNVFKSYSEDFVNLDDFFANHYAILNNDEGIREQLWKIHEVKVNQLFKNKAAETKNEAEKKAAEVKQVSENAKTNVEKKAADVKKVLEDGKANVEKKAADLKKVSEDAKTNVEKKAAAEMKSAAETLSDIRKETENAKESADRLSNTGKNVINILKN
jgi:hypothetical protein